MKYRVISFVLFIPLIETVALDYILSFGVQKLIIAVIAFIIFLDRNPMCLSISNRNSIFHPFKMPNVVWTCIISISERTNH